MATKYGPMVETAYLGPTDCRGSRCKAWTVGGGKRGGSVTIGWRSELDSDANHEAAARAMIARQWPDLVGYDLLRCSRDGGGYVFAILRGDA